jgi:hypothetical protein
MPSSAPPRWNTCGGNSSHGVCERVFHGQIRGDQGVVGQRAVLGLDQRIHGLARGWRHGGEPSGAVGHRVSVARNVGARKEMHGSPLIKQVPFRENPGFEETRVGDIGASDPHGMHADAKRESCWTADASRPYAPSDMTALIHAMDPAPAPFGFAFPARGRDGGPHHLFPIKNAR